MTCQLKPARDVEARSKNKEISTIIIIFRVIKREIFYLKKIINKFHHHKSVKNGMKMVCAESN